MSCRNLPSRFIVPNHADLSVTPLSTRHESDYLTIHNWLSVIFGFLFVFGLKTRPLTLIF